MTPNPHEIAGQLLGDKPVKAKKQFQWKPPGSRGGFGAYFRFNDESRGERFFDTEYSIFRPKPGEVVIGPVVYNGYYRHNTARADLQSMMSAMSPGTSVMITPTFQSPRSTRRFPPINAKVVSTEWVNDNTGILLKYTE